MNLFKNFYMLHQNIIRAVKMVKDLVCVSYLGF
jgi:hypothetical protein